MGRKVSIYTIILLFCTPIYASQYVVGNLGIGTTLSKNTLDVAGGVSIGTTNAGYNIAPANGIIVQGKVGIGTYILGGSFVVLKSGPNDDIAFNDNNPGIEISGVNDIGVRSQLVINAVPLLINTSGGGNIGINSNNPGSTMDIVGTIRTNGYSSGTIPGITSATCTQWTNGLCTHS